MPFFAQINAHIRINLTILYTGLFSPIWHTCFAKLSFSQPGVSCLCGQKHIYVLNVPLLWITSVDSLLFIQQYWNSWLFAELWDELRTAINTGLLCFNSGSCRYQLWQLYFSLVVQIFDMDRANLWCRRINWNKNWGRRRSFPLNTEKQRDRGWAVYVAQVSWLLLINPPAPRICPIWAPNGAAAPIFCPLFSGHFRPIFEPRCPRVPCYPPWWTDRPILVPLWPHSGRTLATSELGPDWASFPRVGLRPDIGFSNIPAPDNLL